VRLTASRRLSAVSRELIAGSSCVVSVARIWEVAIRHHPGKLPVPPRRFRDAEGLSLAIEGRR
jgi:PIN domain nuclease of toxin-antitoxin system